MTLLPDTFQRPAGVGYTIIFVLIGMISTGVSTWGIAQSQIDALETQVSERMDWTEKRVIAEKNQIEKQLTSQLAQQQSQISALRGAVETMKEQRLSIFELTTQIQQVQRDVTEIKEALGLRLRPSVGNGGP